MMAKFLPTLEVDGAAGSQSKGLWHVIYGTLRVDTTLFRQSEQLADLGTLSDRRRMSSLNGDAITWDSCEA